MVQQSARLILLIDDSKFGVKQLERICDLSTIDDIVTNKALPADIGTAAEQSQVSVHSP
jgi:DeoR/GlpR family transcriptional regulator of sugar metabolism